MLKIQEITNKKNWEDFIASVSGDIPPFFQTWNWGEVQKKAGTAVWHLGLYENGKLIGIASVSLIIAKRGTYLHLRHGPVLKTYKKEYIDFLLQFLSEKGKNVNAGFIRLSPLVSKEIASEIFPKLQFRSSQIHAMDAELCWILPLNQPLDDLLKNMRKSHRYLIKKSLSSGVVIKRTKNMHKISQFLSLYTKLAQRKHFVAHHGVKEEMEIFAKDNQAELFLAYFEGKLIAGALIDYVGNTAIYRHSASDERYKHIPAMYLLQWEVIQQAKKRDMKYYNFWGIAPLDKPNHPWKGLSLFKTGFGGQVMEFAHAKDYVLSWKYWPVAALEFVTKLQKGY